MNLWFRLLRYLMTFWRRRRLTLPGDTSVLHFRAWPTDLDTSMHMNNGRYLTVMDLGRLDLMTRSGLAKIALTRGWTPIANTMAVRFRREVHLLNRVRLESRILGWDETHVVIEHQMVVESGRNAGHIAAHGLFKGGLYDRRQKKFVAIADMMAAIDVTADSPPLSTEVQAFLAADAAMKEKTRGPSETVS
jgi:acyl-CoA thioesterase FadM